MKNHLPIFLVFLTSFLYGQKDIHTNAVGTVYPKEDINLNNDGANFEFSFYENVNFKSGLDYAHFEEKRLQNNPSMTSHLEVVQDKFLNGTNICKTDLMPSSHKIDSAHKSPDLKKMELGLSFKPRVTYEIDGKGQLFAKPTFSFSPNNFVNDPNAVKLISLGLEYGYGQLFASFLNKAN